MDIKKEIKRHVIIIKNIFEKALLALGLISYIQPFSDSNKRIARIVSNAILIQHQYFNRYNYE